MTDADASAGLSAERSALELAQLHDRIDEARRMLSRLLQQTVAAAMAGSPNADSLVVKVNEQLVQEALRVQAEAELTEHAQDEAERLGGLDPITRLPMRGRLLDQLAQSLALAQRHDRVLALLDLGLGHFAQIQARLGREAADMLLREVADRISASLRGCDLVGRQNLGGFLIGLVEITQPEDATRVARKIHAALDRPIQVGEQQVQLTASIGIAVFPHDAEQIDALVDTAAAQKGRDGMRRPGAFAMGTDARTSGSLEGSPPSHDEVNSHASGVQAPETSRLRDANERLIVSILDARELSDALLQARHRHVALLAVIAEELRDPQAPVRLAAALLGHAQVDQALLPRVQSMLHEQLRRMKQMLGNLDGLVGTHLDALALARERIDLRAAVQGAMQQAKAAFHARRQRVDVQLGEQPLEVMGDMDRMVQVLENLLDNASKYSGEGGNVAVRGSLVKNSVMLEVCDDGIGLASAVKPQIFAPFWHDAEALAVQGAGVGIGLTVVRKLVEAHNGSVQAHSAGRGLGSRFVVTLPGAQA